ncbi:hypothetical protein FJ364_03390 [Candidatus Dependentiae bacterium]|nr:hypothetical protein [Candidatus Dependentiae bacterium]
MTKKKDVKKNNFVDSVKISRSEGSFVKLRENGGLYVDKTKQIYDCLRRPGYYFLARPRRFGKSILCSTLEELFLANRGYFKGLWIDKSDWDWEPLPTMRFDMSMMIGDTTTPAIVQENLLYTLREYANHYKVSVQASQDAASMLGWLIDALRKKYTKKIVVIIDEYDKPLLDVIHKPQEYDRMLEMLKAFYTKLKGQSANLHLVFATGVFKFSKVGMFFGANNFTDLTFNLDASTLVGYTQEDLEKYFDEGINNLATKLGKKRSEIITTLQEKYNGYRFGYDEDIGALCEGVYNSFGINNVFADTAMTEKWFESGSPAILLKKLHKQNCKALLSQELSANPSKLSPLRAKEEIQPLPLLYFASYFTIEKYERRKLTFKFPNGEVGTAFFEQLIDELDPEHSGAILDLAIDVVLALEDQEFGNLQNLLNQALANAGYQLILSREDQYQLFFVMLLHAGDCLPRVEEVTQDGRIDISITMRHVAYLLELKINGTPQKAIDQIKEKDYARKFRHLKRPIWAIGIKLAGDAKTKKSATKTRTTSKKTMSKKNAEKCRYQPRG